MVVSLDLQASSSDGPTRRVLSQLSLSVAKSRRIVVVTGAGISCSSGIPDFRSSDGLYNLVKQRYPDVVLKGRDLFDASLFRDPTSTSLFYTFISQLKQSIDSASPSPTHHFIKTLDSKKKLLRSYTQNIDGLEERAGLVGSSSQEVKSTGKGKAKIRTKDVRNVQLHGDIHRVWCSYCSVDLPCSEEYLGRFNDGIPPDCPECTSRADARLARSARPLRIGTLRPAVVLYDEAHPLGDDIGAIQATDVSRKPDMLIIMGTSLKVHGLRRLVKDFARAVHASAPVIDPSSTKSQGKSLKGQVVYVNKGAPGSEWNGIIDYHIEGETDAWAEKVLEDWKKARPADWEIQQTLVAAGEDDRGAFTVAKDISGKATNGKKHSAPGTENMPPPIDDVEHPSSPPVKPPSSPTKRRKSTSHYGDGESSPSKKRALGSAAKTRALLDERGMLFGDATNSRADGLEAPAAKGKLGRLAKVVGGGAKAKAVSPRIDRARAPGRGRGKKQLCEVVLSPMAQPKGKRRKTTNSAPAVTTIDVFS